MCLCVAGGGRLSNRRRVYWPSSRPGKVGEKCELETVKRRVVKVRFSGLVGEMR